MPVSNCVICGSYITRRFLICRVCEKDYGLEGKTIAEMDEWAKEFIRSHDRERWQERRSPKRRRERPVIDDWDCRPPSDGLPSQRGLDAAWDELESMGVYSADDFPASFSEY